MVAFSEEKIESWLDEQRISDWTVVREEGGEQFSFEVELHHIPVDLTVLVGPNSLNIIGGFTFDPELLANLLDRKELWHQFRTEAMIVLTNVRGFYAFLDEDFNPTSFEEMRRISLQYFIYPDGASQHLFMNSLYDMARAEAFLMWRPEQMVSALDDQT
ncbi:hypothetical protein [Haloarchaeobius iranensis]|uniref:YbjN domain-containing protein n=1 Tax=Haloarchaeobius iranensis TaxID=996166 RepID=A0A1G9XZ09_9EURY|nr:hypothetical protein [Haloarchaeobius iranensis]SDN01706.1 hypothetical protein SAMN05192554_11240 [Haloarchaeobius iranensis]